MPTRSRTEERHADRAGDPEQRGDDEQRASTGPAKEGYPGAKQDHDEDEPGDDPDGDHLSMLLVGSGGRTSAVVFSLTAVWHRPILESARHRVEAAPSGRWREV